MIFSADVQGNVFLSFAVPDPKCTDLIEQAHRSTSSSGDHRLSALRKGAPCMSRLVPHPYNALFGVGQAYGLLILLTPLAACVESYLRILLYRGLDLHCDVFTVSVATPYNGNIRYVYLYV